MTASCFCTAYVTHTDCIRSMCEKVFSSVSSQTSSSSHCLNRNQLRALGDSFTMKAHHLLIVLLLVSNITLSSGFLDMFVAAASVAYNYFEKDDLLPFDSNRLGEDLRENFFGQHIASNVIHRALSAFMIDSNPNKPLVLSFHGTTGTGKSHVAKIIMRNVYKKGEDSEHVQTYMSTHNFPHKEKSDMYSAQLKQWIQTNVSCFPRSMFIFDEMEKMHPQLIDAIKPFLDYNARVDGVSYRKAIFLFLSNAGGNIITEVALDFWRNGKNREELWMNSKELETKIQQNAFNDENSGFLHSSILDEHLIDHYVPFIPLELKHVRQCVLVEMIHLNVTQDFYLADRVAKDMPYYPKEEKIFSVKGCKSVRQKLFLYIDL